MIVTRSMRERLKVAWNLKCAESVLQTRRLRLSQEQAEWGVMKGGMELKFNT